MNAERLAELLGEWGYAIYLALLLATGVGSPIPEDLLLVTAGYLVSAGVFSWPGALALGVLGIVASDAILYGWGRRLRCMGESRSGMGRLVRPQHIAAVDRWLGRVGDKAVFFGRLLPGTRVASFVGAGIRRMSFGKFLLFDVAGALVWVPPVVYAGAHVGQEVGGLDRLLAAMTRSAAWIIVPIVVLLALWKWWGAEESKL